MSEIVDTLNTHLASYLDLAAQFKQAHWNVRGPSFIGMHKLFDKASDQVRGYADALAERTAALGGEACGTIEDVTERSFLKPCMLGIAPQDQYIKALVGALETTCDEGRKAITSCLDARDQATADVFIELVRGIDQLKYLVGSHVSDRD